MASRRPEHMPWPANGGIRCAASPAISTRPRRQSVGVAGAEGVDGVALERRVVRADVPRGEQLPGRGRIVQLLDRLVREAHELPAPPARSARDERRRPRRIAELPVERRPDARLVRDHVDHEPVEGEAEIVPGAADRAAHEAVRAVAADGVARAHLERLARLVARAEQHVIARVVQHVRVVAAQQAHVRERARAPLERGFETRLMTHVRVGPAREAGLLLAAEAQQDLARGVAPLVDRRGLGEALEIRARCRRLCSTRATS